MLGVFVVVRNVVVGRSVRLLQRLKAVSALCARQSHCQFCLSPAVMFRQQGITITAKLAVATTPFVMVPAGAIFASLVRLPDGDLATMGFHSVGNHPCNAIMSSLLVLPPVARPAMKTMNLKTGNPFVVEPGVRPGTGGGPRPRTPSRWSTKASWPRSTPCARRATDTSCGTVGHPPVLVGTMVHPAEIHGAPRGR
jgi:hypothetical protein